MLRSTHAIGLVGLVGAVLAVVALRGPALLTGQKPASGAVTQEAIEHRSLPVAGLSRVVLEGRSAEVHLKAGDVQALELDIRRIARGADAAAAQERLKALNFEARQEKDTWKLKLDEPAQPVSWPKPAGGPLAEVSFVLDVTAPRALALDWNLEVGAGDLTIEGLKVAAAHLESASGAIEAREVDGPLVLSVASGRIVVAGGQGDTRAEAASGGVTVRDRAGGQLHVKTAAGDIGLDLLRGLPQATSAESSAGSVTLAIAPSADARFALSTVSGSIEDGLHLRREEEGATSFVGDQLTATLGKGRHPVSITTTSGLITLVPGSLADH